MGSSSALASIMAGKKPYALASIMAGKKPYALASIMAGKEPYAEEGVCCIDLQVKSPALHVQDLSMAASTAPTA